ncbi:MAG: hypothetical protein KIS96_12080 [Bauldia sp.]|nr:hypothetical protein [Bauldia sp.]
MSRRLMKFIRGAGVASALAFLPVAMVVAAVPAAAQMGLPGEQYLLSEEEVVAFIASYPEIAAAMETLDERYDLPEDEVDSPAGAIAAMGAYQEAMAELDGVVVPYGFDGFLHWTQVFSAIAVAYAYAMSGGMDAQMAEALAQIEADPNIPEDQKAAMRQMFASQAAMLAANAPPQQNIDLVTEHLEALDAIMTE